MSVERERFVQAYHEALKRFDEWVYGLSEPELKVHFRQLALIRECLRGAIREGEEMRRYE